jgi:dTDP-4-dehydrorhamnose 3,5-epimerase-like enzyme
MHVFYAATGPALVVVGTTHEYDPDDDIKCRWQDADLDIDESITGTIDPRAHSLEDVIAVVNNRG